MALGQIIELNFRRRGHHMIYCIITDYIVFNFKTKQKIDINIYQM